MFVRVHPGKRKGVYGNSRAYGFSTPRLASQAAEITPPRAVPSAEGLFGFGGVVRHTTVWIALDRQSVAIEKIELGRH